MLESWSGSLFTIVQETLLEFSIYLPKIAAALLVFIIGSTIAKALEKLVITSLDALKLSKVLEKTPIEHFIKNAEISKKIEQILGSVVYWLIMLIIIQTSIDILGLTPLSEILEKILAFIPNIISAVLILFLAILLAGVVESLVKASIRNIDPKTSRTLGKISSYLVVIVGILIGISELGIASEFILILFVGLVGAVSLGLGLALGLGGQDLVKKLLDSYYRENIKK